MDFRRCNPDSLLCAKSGRWYARAPPKVDGWFAGVLKETALIKLKFCIQRNRSTLTISKSDTPLFDEEPE